MLSRLAFDLLATPASSSACEREFSLAGHVLDNERWQTKTDYAQSHQLLRNWFKNDLVLERHTKEAVRAQDDNASGDDMDSELPSSYEGSSQ